MNLRADLTSSLRKTEQQAAIIEDGKAGHSLIITARAGCAKTTTLELLANELPPTTRGGYLAFNKKVADEARGKFPDNFQCLTLNGLGHRAWQVGRPRLRLPNRGDPAKTTVIIEEELKRRNLSLSFDERKQHTAILNAARTLCLVPKGLPGVGFREDTEDDWREAFAWAEVDIEEKRFDENLILARSFLRNSISVAMAGFIDFADQIYMPVCFGGNWPTFDVLFGDEAQDFSPANLKMIRLTRAKQKILVGDPKQAIYAFRGAMTDSMDHLESTMPEGTEWKHLTLTRTFRCGKAIVARQKAFCPDFEAAEGNPDGEIVSWPAAYMKDDAEQTQAPTWEPKMVPDGSAILCRNNAPLVSCALKFLQARRKVTVLGRDFADRLKRDISKATKGAPGHMPIEQVHEAMEKFYTTQFEKPGRKMTEEQLEAIQDRVKAIVALSEGCERLSDLSDNIAKVFSDEVAPVTLATGHKAKGLEWDFVLHLNPHLIPSSWSKADPEQLKQEYNLRYVIETRARKTLVLADLEDLEC